MFNTRLGTNVSFALAFLAYSNWEHHKKHIKKKKCIFKYEFLKSFIGLSSWKIMLKSCLGLFNIVVGTCSLNVTILKYLINTCYCGFEVKLILFHTYLMNDL